MLFSHECSRAFVGDGEGYQTTHCTHLTLIVQIYIIWNLLVCSHIYECCWMHVGAAGYERTSLSFAPSSVCSWFLASVRRVLRARYGRKSILFFASTSSSSPAWLAILLPACMRARDFMLFTSLVCFSNRIVPRWVGCVETWNVLHTYNMYFI